MKLRHHDDEDWITTNLIRSLLLNYRGQENGISLSELTEMATHRNPDITPNQVEQEVILLAVRPPAPPSEPTQVQLELRFNPLNDRLRIFCNKPAIRLPYRIMPTLVPNGGGQTDWSETLKLAVAQTNLAGCSTEQLNRLFARRLCVEGRCDDPDAVVNAIDRILGLDPAIVNLHGRWIHTHHLKKEEYTEMTQAALSKTSALERIVYEHCLLPTGSDGIFVADISSKLINLGLLADEPTANNRIGTSLRNLKKRGLADYLEDPNTHHPQHGYPLSRWFITNPGNTHPTPDNDEAEETWPGIAIEVIWPTINKSLTKLVIELDDDDEWTLPLPYTGKVVLTIDPQSPSSSPRALVQSNVCSVKLFFSDGSHQTIYSATGNITVEYL